MELNKTIYNLIYKKNFKRKDSKIILIDGITCSGKSTLAKKISNYLNKQKIPNSILSKDLFLKSRRHRIKLLKNKKKKFINQNIEHYQIKKFKEVLSSITHGNKPDKIKFKNLYDRKTGLNNLNYIFVKQKNHLYIVEGIYVGNDINSNPNIISKILLYSDFYTSIININNKYPSSKKYTIKEYAKDIEAFINKH